MDTDICRTTDGGRNIVILATRPRYADLEPIGSNLWDVIPNDLDRPIGELMGDTILDEAADWLDELNGSYHFMCADPRCADCRAKSKDNLYETIG